MRQTGELLFLAFNSVKLRIVRVIQHTYYSAYLLHETINCKPGQSFILIADKTSYMVDTSQSEGKNPF